MTFAARACANHVGRAVRCAIAVAQFLRGCIPGIARVVIPVWGVRDDPHVAQGPCFSTTYNLAHVPLSKLQ